MIIRQKILNQLISKKHNGQIKIVTGLRRVGKSFLLFELFRSHLVESGISPDHIVPVVLDDDVNASLRNPLKLSKYIRDKITDSQMYYVLVDEIQMVKSLTNPDLEGSDDIIGFEDVLLGLQRIKNVDLYVTGSNSRMLSSEVVTQFRGRGDEIRVFPLTYKEFYENYDGDKRNAWRDYFTYGGMPYAVLLKSFEEKSKYLKDLFEHTYIRDILERNRIRGEQSVLDDLLNVISSAIGSLTNPTKLSGTFESAKKIKIGASTISKYLGYFEDAFLIRKSSRYDIKGRKYIGGPLKYYYTDVGLCNARLNFRQVEENHVMENIIYNELIERGFCVDVGIVEHSIEKDGKKSRTQLEVDFVANNMDRRYYIQSALHIDDEDKRKQETNSLNRIQESFKKIVVVKDNIIPWHDERGILYVGVEQFLLDEKAMDL